MRPGWETRKSRFGWRDQWLHERTGFWLEWDFHSMKWTLETTGKWAYAVGDLGPYEQTLEGAMIEAEKRIPGVIAAEL